MTTSSDISPRKLRSEKRDTAIGAAILFLLINLTLFPFVWGDKTLQDSVSTASFYGSGSTPQAVEGQDIRREFDSGAPSWELEPLLVLVRQLMFEKHIAPTWNPFSAYGTPLAADMPSQPYNPLAWIAMLLPPAIGYDIFVMLRLFLAGLFSFLFLRQFFGLAPSLFGGSAFMYTGYLWIYLNMQEISVEVLVPALLLAGEKIVRSPNPRTAAFFAFVYAWSVLGGMPESTILAVAFGILYLVARLFRNPLRAKLRPIVTFVAAGAATAFCLAAIQILPFYEFVKRSFTLHTTTAGIPGLDSTDPFDLAYLERYITPLGNGPPWNYIFTDFSGGDGIRGFFGTAATFFAVLAVVRFIRTRDWREMGSLPVSFFAAISFALLSKRFGAFYINWIGDIPGFQLVLFNKYEEAVLGCAVAVLAACGVDAMMRKVVSYWDVIVTATLLLACLTAEAGIQKAAYLALADHADFYILSLFAGLVTLLYCAVIVLLAKSGRMKPIAIGLLAVTGVVLELNGAYIVPMFYVITTAPPRSLSTYLQHPPYVRFLKANAANDRVYGEDQLLYPDWSAPLGLQDVRAVDPLYYERYLPFVQAFFKARSAEELFDRFTGDIPTSFRDPVERRFLELSSVRYILSGHDLGYSVLDKVANDNPGISTSYFRVGDFAIGGSTKHGLFIHPPRNVASKLNVPKAASFLDFSIGLLPDVWQGPICGDGVSFTITLESGGIKRSLKRYIDPKHDLSERRWIGEQIDVASLRGQTARLSLKSAVGPSGSPCADWGVIGDMHFDGPEQAGANGLSLAYRDPSAMIYRFSDPMPRVAAFAHVDLRENADAALAELVAPTFDPMREAIVDTDVPEEIAQLGSSPEAPAVSGIITSYESTKVTSSITLSKPSLVVLNDTWFPGWVADVDGKPAAVVHANYLFRGVLVPPGFHTVTFRYEPNSFKNGFILTQFGLVLFVILSVGVPSYGMLRKTRSPS